MPTFEIRYVKRLCDDTGHEHDACQSIIAIEAPNACEALRLAEAQVCGSRHLSDWTIFADAVELRATSPLRAAPKTDISFADLCAGSE
jgi:hypothetical protein